MFYKLISLRIFGIPYCIPFVPLEKNELDDSIIKKETKLKKRNSYLTKNIIRGKYR